MADAIATDTEIQAEARVTVSFDLKDIYRTYGGDHYENLPEALLNSLAAAMVKRIAEDRDGYQTLVSAILKTREAVIREMVGPVVAEAFTAPIQQTNTYGEPTGKTATLRELIVSEATKFLGQPTGYDRKETQLQVVIRKEIESTWEREIKATIDAAKAEVRKAVQEKATGILAQTIQAMAVPA